MICPQAKVSPRTGTPIRITALTAVLVAILAGLIPLDEIAALANAGTLAAFVAVSVSMLVMRVRAPDAERRFRTPAAWPVGLFAIAGCLYLFYSLPATTQLYFALWNVAGLAVYLLYGARRAQSGRVLWTRACVRSEYRRDAARHALS